ncbi:hypothetical protein Tco_0242946 [Tanacetum coccineum]
MAGESGSNSVVDDLIELSGKTDPNEYLKLFVNAPNAGLKDVQRMLGRCGDFHELRKAEAVEVKERWVSIMDTQAIDDQAHLANYDSDNEIENDDLGYHSEEYFDDAHEDYENNHSNGNVVKRGITRFEDSSMEQVNGASKCLLSAIMGRGGIRTGKRKMKETEDKIKEGTLRVDQGTDAMTLVLADERILLLESQLDAARRERKEEELLIKSDLRDIHPVYSMLIRMRNERSLECDQNDASIRKENAKKATPPSTIQMITVENKTAPKVPTKRKNFYVSSDAMQKEANKKRSQKALVY